MRLGKIAEVEKLERPKNWSGQKTGKVAFDISDAPPDWIERANMPRISPAVEKRRAKKFSKAYKKTWKRKRWAGIRALPKKKGVWDKADYSLRLIGAMRGKGWLTRSELHLATNPPYRGAISRALDWLWRTGRADKMLNPNRLESELERQTAARSAAACKYVWKLRDGV